MQGRTIVANALVDTGGRVAPLMAFTKQPRFALPLLRDTEWDSKQLPVIQAQRGVLFDF